MTQEVKDFIIKYYNGQKGRAYPCSNQSVHKIIFCQDIDEYIYKFLFNKKFVPIRRAKEQIEGFIGTERWLVVKIRESQRGRRAFKAKIDKRIPDDIVRQIIMPMMDLYCCEVETF